MTRGSASTQKVTITLAVTTVDRLRGLVVWAAGIIDQGEQSGAARPAA